MAVAMRFGGNSNSSQNISEGGGGGGGGGITMKLVWTNPNPNSAFAAQTVSLDLSEYDIVGITAAFSSDRTQRQITWGVLGTTVNCIYKAFSANNFASRRAYITATGVQFYNGYQDSSAKSDSAVPIEIYGIKGIT